MIWHEEIVFASIAFEADQIEPWMRWHLVLEVKEFVIDRCNSGNVDGDTQDQARVVFMDGVEI
jgi:hypothetical protein